MEHFHYAYVLPLPVILEILCVPFTFISDNVQTIKMELCLTFAFTDEIEGIKEISNNNLLNIS